MNRNSILNVEVSCFRDYDTARNPKPVNLLDWLQSDKYADQVRRIRSITDKDTRDKLKAKLPCITPGGLFSYRKTDKLLRASGLVQLDIDPKGNDQVTNLCDLKSYITRLGYVAYCGLSVSAKGFWLLIPIKDEQFYKDHWIALADDWKVITGIILDPARSDIAGLRGYSYDPDAYFNHSAECYTKRYSPPKPQIKPPQSFEGDAKDVFEFAMRRMKSKGINFAEGARHTFIFEFCCILNTFGIDQQRAEAWINSSLIPLHEIESNCISDPYKRYQADFGKLSFRSREKQCRHGAKLTGQRCEPLRRPVEIRPYKLPITPNRNAEVGQVPVDFAPPEMLTNVETEILKKIETNVNYCEQFTTDSEKKVEPELLVNVGTENLLKPVIEQLVKLSISGNKNDKKREPWDSEIKQLESFFKTVSLPTQPVRLNGCESITDSARFVRSHFTTVRANNGNKTFLPYLNRLQEVKQYLITNQN